MNRPSKRTTRTGLLAGLWVAAAAGALLLGLTAVGQIGSGLAGGDPVPPMAAEEVEASLARHAADPAQAPAAPSPAPQSPASQPAPAAEPSPTGVVPAGRAGSVLARCEGDVPRVVSVNPAQGFEREDDDDLAPGQVLLDGDDLDVRVTLSCANGTPSGEVTTVVED
ncbi:hypothetical protein SAMN05216207_1001235 [Pseudonocardia ammonioxydans]|uniref:Uncharacterized protein n=1 Tax=Pseudonocardia ammonioxydans TaxID=260086 RepID=A0A1I4S4Q1_PSUAM|nr:hypothetical protein [Pseudonocardia ammonioxydans]SFM59254.1 hypothetical protein SAMN05216207_1001235 [Pseudonocardia ammonioxydans]